MTLLNDLRLAARGLVRAPGLLAVATLSLGVGIAALTTLWAGLDTIFGRPLPYDPEGTLVFVGTVQNGRGGPSSPTSAADFLALRDGAISMETAAYRDRGINLAGDPAEWVAARHVSGAFFRVMGVEARLGRLLTPSDAEAGAPDVAVLGQGLWRRRFGADPAVLGNQIVVDGQPAIVVGILPADFEFGFDSPDLWLPLRPGLEGDLDARSLNVVARRSAPLAAVTAELSTLAQVLARERPATNAQQTFRANGVRDEWFGGGDFRQGAAAAMVAAALVLLMACVNVANLLLARGAGRTEEMALRRALGAGRLRLVGQLLAEAVVLAAAAGAVGLLLSVVGLRGLRNLMPAGMPRATEVGMDGRVLLLGFAVAFGSVLLFGLAPALRTVGRGAARLGTGTTRGSTGGGGRLRGLLVGAQLALAMVLLASTALVLRSVDALRGVDMGFDTAGVMAFDVNLPEADYPDEASLRVTAARIEEAVTAAPAVGSAGIGVGVPTRLWRSVTFRLESDDAGADPVSSMARFATPSYLATLGIRARRGRDLAAGDDAGAPPVALVNELFARRHWPDADAVGQVLRVGERAVTVAGVVPDFHEYGPAFPPQTALYLPLAQWPARQLSIVAAGPDAAAVVEAVREAVRGIDPALAVHGQAAVRDILMASAEQFTALARLLAVLGLAALLLGVVGVYGSMAYTVARRVPEFGVRMAVGADAAAIRRLVLRDAGRVAAAGTGVGLLLALGAARGLRAFLFGVGTGDPVAFGAVVILLVGISLAAAWLPARRAGGVDPLDALRSG